MKLLLGCGSQYNRGRSGQFWWAGLLPQPFVPYPIQISQPSAAFCLPWSSRESETGNRSPAGFPPKSLRFRVGQLEHLRHGWETSVVPTRSLRPKTDSNQLRLEMRLPWCRAMWSLGKHLSGTEKGRSLEFPPTTPSCRYQEPC